MNQYFISLIRTWVPIAIGWLIAQLLTLGVVFDDTTSKMLETALTAATIAIYYAVARWLEQKFPKAGLLIGYIKQPLYVDPTKTSAVQSGKIAEQVKDIAKPPEAFRPQGPGL